MFFLFLVFLLCHLLKMFMNYKKLKDSIKTSEKCVICMQIRIFNGVLIFIKENSIILTQ